MTGSASTELLLDLMELEDHKTPSDVVEEILRQNPNLVYPTPLERFVELAGIESISELSTDGFEGMLITNPEKSRGAIMIKAGTSPRRRRFTIAHELGHFLLPWHRQQKFSCKSSDIKDSSQNRGLAPELVSIETEANTFASELLMPSSAFKSLIDDFETPTLNALTTLSETFDVSFEATVHRYKALSNKPLAFVFSHNNIVRYWVKTQEMPYALKVRKDQALPLRSASRNNGNSVSDFETIAAHIWLEPHSELALPRNIMEQTIHQSSGYKVTLLYVENLFGLEYDQTVDFHDDLGHELEFNQEVIYPEAIDEYTGDVVFDESI
ncbi:MAG: ImmA/IrrE family metallo-endopeptidase [Gammaproteobacteria bacterium]|nr:ImmA/IrrE family metallo-endopeptidase [Gammaproteobacteria bacterium]